MALVLACAVGVAAPTKANPRPVNVRLSVADVARILRQVVAEAQAQGVGGATIAVTDRVGNVLALYQHGTPSSQPVTLRPQPGQPVPTPRPNTLPVVVPQLQLSGILPTAGVLLAAAVSKAVTGAYLSSGGNAFSTRTASQIVQENFVPGSRGLEGGPLFGVQFSQLPCSDLAVRFATNATSKPGLVDPTVGPKRTPLGLAADPGGFPLYRNGAMIGGIGVIADNNYGYDRNIRDRETGLANIDEILALAGTRGFDAPIGLRADRVTVDGRTLRYSDATPDDLRSPANGGAGISLRSTGFAALPGYSNATIVAGQAFGFPGSGIQPDTSGRFGSLPAYILSGGAGGNRFPPRSGTGGANGLTAQDVTVILREALGVALTARGQIRRPLNSTAEVTISVVDASGNILGIARTPDAPVFGTDVSLQKARSAMFLSNAASVPVLASKPEAQPYLAALRNFLGSGFVPGTSALTARSIGNLARPFYPDGVNGRSNGPLSVPEVNFSPFDTGLQSDLGLGNLGQHVLFLAGKSTDTPAVCAGSGYVANGLQIFPGGEPIYRNGQLVGGIGVSGDGIDQDDMIGFLGAERAFRLLGRGLSHANPAFRADRLRPQGVGLRYVSCPYAPFVGSDTQNVCRGI
jgi:uncharacterized protein GlcG (DUF336 family)